MYTRNYFQDDENISIPENYDGNAFREDVKEPPIQSHNGDRLIPPFTPHSRTEEECAAFEDAERKKRDGDSGFVSTFLQKLQPSSLFEKFNFFNGGHFDFGGEEIMIIGIALFLLFSEGKDIECALMLLLLLLIK